MCDSTMYASRHALFVGPGSIPPGLEASLRPIEMVRPAPGLGPRLVGVFDSATTLEHAAELFAVHHVASLAAGPEQPPVEDIWYQPVVLEPRKGRWWVHLPSKEPWRLNWSAVTGLTSVDWRLLGSSELAARALLVQTTTLDRSLFIRSGADDPDAFGLLAEFLEACGQRIRPDARIRSRRVSPEVLGAPILQGDLLPLAVAVVDALDTRAGELPGR